MKHKSLKRTIIGILISVSLSLVVISMLLMMMSTKTAIIDTFKRNGEVTAQEITSQLNVEAYEQWLKNPINNEQYQQFVDQLNTIRQHAGVLYVYTLSEENGKLKIMVDGMDDPVPIASDTTATQYRDVESTFNGKSASSDITTDEVFGDYISSFAPIKNNNGETIGVLAIDVDANIVSDIQSQVQLHVFEENLLFILIIVVILIFIIVLVNRSVSKKINPLTNLMNATHAISEGNISKAKQLLQENIVTGNNEIGDLYQSTTIMNEKLENLIGKMNNISATISDESLHLGESSSNVKGGANQVTTSMQEMAKAAESEVVLTSNLHAQMDEFTSLYEQTTEQGNEIVEATNKLIKDVQIGTDLMDSSKNEMENIYQIISHSVEQITKLNEQIKNVNSLITLISDISEQTNLLSLNASIEAARAGEAGRGFAVVAGEVGNLSSKVAESVNDITVIIEEVTSNSIHMVNLLEQGLENVSLGRENLIQTDKTFSNISNSVSSVNHSIMKMSEQLSTVKEKETEINKYIIEVAAISEENTACIQEVAASAQVMNTSMESLDELVLRLQETAKELNYIGDQFKIDKNGDL